MAFDGMVLNAVASELKSTIMNGKVQKIYEPNEQEILISIYANSMQYALSFNVSSSLYSCFLTTNKKVNPLVAPNFCMLLRKHLIGYKLTKIETYGLERVITFYFTGNDENYEISTKKLVLELMGKYSNVLLLNEQNVIIDALKHFSIDNGSTRNILPHFSYEYPTSSKWDLENVPSDINNYIETEDVSLSDFFAKYFTGISKTFAAHSISCLITHLQKNSFTVSQDIEISRVLADLSNNKLTNETFTVLLNYILKLKNNISNVKCVNLEKDYCLEYAETVEPLQVNFFLDDYYLKKEQSEQFLAFRNSLLSLMMGKLKKISVKLSNIDQKILECKQMDNYKLYGELITSYLYQISNKHACEIELANYYDNNRMIKIPLDISLSPNDNAKKYFKKYHKLKNTVDIVEVQKQKLQQELDYIQSIVYTLQASTTIKELDAIYEEIQGSFTTHAQKQKKKGKKVKNNNNKKEAALSPICYEIDGFKVLVGRNNKQNDELTFKIAGKEDIWLHVKNLQGSHVILVTNKKVPNQETINKCASIAAFHSKAVQSSNVAVDYTLVKYVKKPNKVKPGMVVFTNQETVNVQPKSAF